MMQNKVFLFSVLFLLGCTYDHTEPSNSQILDIPFGFDFSTHRKVNININDTQDHVIYDIYSYSRLLEDVESFTLTNDEILMDGSIYKKLLSASTVNNSIRHTINLPKDVTSLCIGRKVTFGFDYSIHQLENNQLNYVHSSNSRLIHNKESIQNHISKSIQTNFSTNRATNFNYMGSYSYYWGVPNYLAESDVIDQDLIDVVSYSIPERKPVPVFNPQYIDTGVETDVKLSGLADVWVTFVNEGAGYKNALAYYTYDINNPPLTENDIGDLNIIFPNASLSGSGGGLYSGNKVYLGQFDENTGIGWAIIANGWNSSYNSVSQYSPIYYSNPDYNPENSASNRYHNVILKDEVRDLLLIGFEDLNRDHLGTDHDFNDLVFYVTANPYENIIIEDYREVDQTLNTDSDNDGISDDKDAYPEDNSKAFRIFSPNETGKSTLAFEDLWPSTGDYDFNDLAFSYRSVVITNALNNAVQIDFICNVSSNYAGFTNAIGIELEGVAPSQIQSVSGTNYTEGYLSFNANGTEANQDNAVIIFTDNADNFLQERTVSIVLSTPISTEILGAAPFNPFIIANKDRSKEIHLANMEPTNLGEEGSYTTATGFPWGLSIINDNFKVPKEGVSILEAYNYFDEWAISGATERIDWHSNTGPGYRNEDKLDD